MDLIAFVSAIFFASSVMPGNLFTRASGPFT